MRIVAIDAPTRPVPALTRPDPRVRQHALRESLALAVVSVAVVVGLWTTYRQQATHLRSIAADLGNGSVLDIRAVDAAALAPVLSVFPSDVERAFAARRIVEWVHAGGGLTHVGALATITVPVSAISGDARLTVLGERARARPSAVHVPLLMPADVAAIKPALVVRTRVEYERLTAFAAVLFLLSFWVTHVARRLLGTTAEATVLPAMMLLTGLSLIAMMSLRDPLRDTHAAWSVAVGVALACVALTAISVVDFESPRLRFATGVPLGLAVMLATLLLLFGSGPGESGVKVNLWGVQPIEAIRILAVFSLAAYFSRRWETLRELSSNVGAGFSGSSAGVAGLWQRPRWSDVTPLVVIVGTLLVFFFLQKDLGPALVLGALSLALYGVARGRSSLVLAGFAVLIAGFAAGYRLGVPATVAKRVSIWLDPWDNGLVRGDQIAHGLWAMASGGVRGVGVGAGDGQVVPAAHTDLIVAVLGEEIGIVGTLVLAAVYALLVWRMLRVAARAPGDYTMFLALGCALSLAVPAIVIVGGVLGVIPLSGVVTPFLSFGKSSMVCNFVAVGIVLAIARRGGTIRPRFERQVRTVGIVLACAVAVLVADAARVQAWHADDIAVRPTLVQQADGVARYQYNPRLILAARRIPRGTIYDRNGLALATSDPERAATLIERLGQLGLGSVPCPAPPARCYPLQGRGFHLLGDWNRQVNWTASNASFVERDENAVLQGFDDHAQVIQRTLPGGGKQTVVMRDLRELLPLVRHKADPDDSSIRAILERPRDVTVSVDGVFQALVSRALEARVKAAGAGRGAVAVIDPDTGELLASASYPYPSESVTGEDASALQTALLDRARYGLYPPGSTFKLITAAAALRTNAGPGASFMCQRLPDGRVGTRIPGFGRPVRDDVLDRAPHGLVDLHRGLVVSCNAYFAQLAVRVGPQAIMETAAATGIRVALDPIPVRLKRTLPYAGYGQGEVVASPLRMARVAGAIATDGVLRDTTLLRVEDVSRTASRGSHATARWLTPEQASYLATTMRDVVREGTGRVLAAHPVAIAGKTGTAEASTGPAHSWFVGFAPYATRGRRIAFATIVENAGYGSRVAAPLAGDVVSAAVSAGVIR
jgi:cell division protein FtsW (lipid II flippase)